MNKDDWRLFWLKLASKFSKAFNIRIKISNIESLGPSRRSIVLNFTSSSQFDVTSEEASEVVSTSWSMALLVTIILWLQLLESIPGDELNPPREGEIQRGPGICVAYGMCEMKNGLPCVNNTAPQPPPQDQAAKEKLNELCPHLGWDSETFTTIIVIRHTVQPVSTVLLEFRMLIFWQCLEI